MTSLLLFGFLIGMRHALEADHVAAVASLATHTGSLKQALKQGAVWGLGHTVTLFIFGSAAIWLDTLVPETLANTLEFIVGAMLVILGIDVLRRMMKEKIHYHIHEHNNHEHFHAHSHAHEVGHAQSTHNHTHPDKFPLRSLFVGLMHGMAGSAALIILALATIQSPLQGMLYILVFGIGSIAGMAVFSIVIAIPLKASANGLTWLHNGLQTVIGVFTIGLGGAIMYQLGIAA